MAVKTEPRFEDQMKRLEEIVTILENNEKPLDESISLFEEGVALADECDKKLRQYEEKVNTIIKRNSDQDGTGTV